MINEKTPPTTLINIPYFISYHCAFVILYRNKYYNKINFLIRIDKETITILDVLKLDGGLIIVSITIRCLRTMSLRRRAVSPGAYRQNMASPVAEIFKKTSVSNMVIYSVFPICKKSLISDFFRLALLLFANCSVRHMVCSFSGMVPFASGCGRRLRGARIAASNRPSDRF